MTIKADSHATRNLVIIGGSTGAGAVIGGATGGGKGAAISGTSYGWVFRFKRSHSSIPYRKVMLFVDESDRSQREVRSNEGTLEPNGGVAGSYWTISGEEPFGKYILQVVILGELAPQLEGISPDDEILEPYVALTEELDAPLAIHVLSAQPYFLVPRNRAALNNPILLEKILVRHPKLRVYVMHAGWPMLNEMISLLSIYPQVYVEVAGINWLLPRKEFHRYLRGLVEAGFGKRIMFGSDASMWPQTISIGIEAIESADFLTEDQKRDIFCRNAARFLRLDLTTCDEQPNEKR